MRSAPPPGQAACYEKDTHTHRSSADAVARAPSWSNRVWCAPVEPKGFRAGRCLGVESPLERMAEGRRVERGGGEHAVYRIVVALSPSPLLLLS